jgi:dolichol-phosphate mannosyltransferase
MLSTSDETVSTEQLTAVPASKVVGVTNVSIVVPLFNESEGLSRLLESLLGVQVAHDQKCRFEFVLVDDGSSDGTFEFLREAIAGRDNFCLLRHSENRGIAAAIHTGIVHAGSEIVASIDSDGSYDLDLLAAMLPLIESGADLVIASPYHPQGRVENVTRWRIMLSRLASAMYRSVMRCKLTCYTSCYRIYRRSEFLNLVTDDGGFVGIAELVWRADRQGLAIVDYPAVLRPRQIGSSKMKVVRAMLAHLRLIGRIALSRLRPSTNQTESFHP